MKITAILFALLVSVSVSFAADEKKPAEGAKPTAGEKPATKPAEGAKPAEGDKPAAKPEGEKPKPDLAAAFAKKDGNGDGKVSKEEFLKDQKDATKAEAQFTKKDKDKDGSLNKEEFTAGGGKKKEAK